MKIAISLPDELFEDLERAVKEAGTSRSAFVASALEEKLKRILDDEFTANVNAAIEAHGQPDVTFVREASRRMATDGDWVW
jgi:metal-responsive CopG/Arc/MetJ family transcriptional regulator